MREITVNRYDDYTYTMYALFDGYECDGEYLYNMHLNTEQSYNTYEEVRCLLPTVKPGVYRIYCVEKTAYRNHNVGKTVIMYGDCYAVEDIVIKTYVKRGDNHGF